MHASAPRPWNLLLLGAASFAVTLAYLKYFGATAALAGTGVPALAPPPPAVLPVPRAISTDATSRTSDVPPTAGTADLDGLLTAAVGEDPDRRQAAIAALADAPRARALPVLLQILERGAQPADRHAALLALRTQARLQGDADGAIHDALRENVHDGSDEELSAQAAQVLEELDAGDAGTPT